MEETRSQMYQYNYLIGDNDIDDEYSHVHHARALHFLEAARLQFLRDIGCSNDFLISKGIFSVLASLTIKYKRELLRGAIQVTCENFRLQGKSLYVTQKIFNERGKEAIWAELELKFMDGSSRRAIAVPRPIARLFEPTPGGVDNLT